MAFSNRSRSTVQSAADEVFTAPCFGGRSGTYLMTPPAISIFGIYLFRHISACTSGVARIPHWSKNGSKRMISSPGSMKAMKALRQPSFAPLVMVISVLGFSSLPKKGEYASAIAFFNLGRPWMNISPTPSSRGHFCIKSTLVGAY